MLSASVTSPGLIMALREMMHLRDGSDIKRVPIPRDLVGKPFSDAMGYFYTRENAILIGVITEKRTFNLDDMLSESSSIDEFIRRKFEEAGRSLSVESRGRINVKLNPGPDYRIIDDDLAIIISPNKIDQEL
jgi:voltage-gated potassium channel